MPLSVGDRLGHYEIRGHLGSGGMGDVYRALDTKLNRDVAIKVLPEALSQEDERLARFKREAQLLAALNHPLIAAIHGLEDSGATHFLVLEFVPGETLQARLARGRLEVSEALAIAVQIAAALAEAHDKGIVHRDLKPGNVMLTEDGGVKVLDFGLARALEKEAPAQDASQSPTLTRDVSRTGVILGTAAYMSPEQARGREVDKRSDVFSFGAVLFEMLSGKKAFPGEDVSDILASVIKLEPDWSALPDALDPRIETLLRRCLEKDRTKRRRDVGDVGMELQDVLAHPRQGKAAIPTSGRTVVLACLAGLAAGIAATWIARPTPDPPPVTKFTIPSEGLTLRSRHGLAVSPDGRTVAFTRNGLLHLRHLDSQETTALPGTDRARSFVFSPDGQWILFESLELNGLYKSPVTGGTPVRLTTEVRQHGLSWVDDTFYFAEWGSGSGRIVRMPANGGASEVLLEREEDERLYFPRLLPDGQTILLTVVRGGVSNFAVESFSLTTKERRVLVPGGSDARFLPSGHLVYRVGSTLQGARFDLGKLELTGTPATIVEGVAPVVGGGDRGGAHYAVSENGTLVYLEGKAAARQLTWIDRQGRSDVLRLPPASYTGVQLSPDKRFFALELDGDIWLYDVERNGSLRRLTYTGDNRWPRWSPDGESIVFGSRRTGAEQIFRRAADGRGEAEQVSTGDFDQHPDSFSPDGAMLVFHEHHPDNRADLGLLDVATGEVRSFLSTPFDEKLGKVSPDGRWLAYVSDESGESGVYVTPFPEGGPKTPVSIGGHDDSVWSGVGSPAWSTGGRELFFRDGNRLMAAPIELGEEITVGLPEFLFETRFNSPVIADSFDVTADGARFLVDRQSDESVSIELHVVLNWFEELERLLPAP